MNKFSVLGLLLLFILIGCGKSDKSDVSGLSLDIDKISDVNVEGGSFRVMVSSSEEWQSQTSASWLSVNATKGSTTTRVTIKVAPNYSDKTRAGLVTFKTANDSKSVTISQRKGDLNINEVRYELPVVFHVLYKPGFVPARKDTVNPQVPESRIQEIMRRVNLIYAGHPVVMPNPKTPLPDPKVQFVLAKTDPQGHLMKEPGIDRVAIDKTELPYSDVMNDKKGGTYHNMAWPVDKYINIYLFKFEPDKKDKGTVLGVSFMPYVVSSHPLEGLTTFNPAVLDQVNHCLVINAYNVYDQFDRGSITDPYQRIRQSDVSTTVAHELGHYLGLFHVFAEKHTSSGNVMLNTCLDSDYCKDTPSYDRDSYFKPILDKYGSGKQVLDYNSVPGLFERISCDDTKYTSVNIMDYQFSDTYRFTADQCKRMRHVLYYSPTVPGLKVYGKLRSEDIAGNTQPLLNVCTERTLSPLHITKR